MPEHHHRQFAKARAEVNGSAATGRQTPKNLMTRRREGRHLNGAYSWFEREPNPPLRPLSDGHPVRLKLLASSAWRECTITEMAELKPRLRRPTSDSAPEFRELVDAAEGIGLTWRNPAPSDHERAKEVHRTSTDCYYWAIGIRLNCLQIFFMRYGLAIEKGSRGMPRVLLPTCCRPFRRA